MGNALLATTALALVSGPALAADMLSVGVGGYMQQWFGMADRDDEGAEGGWAVHSDSEIYFKGSLASDSGLNFGVHVELEGDGGETAMDESFVSVSGEFGKLEFGARDHAMVRLHAGISDVGVGLTSGDTQAWIPGTYLETAGHGGTAGGGNDPKLSYISPRVSGLQIGVSYAPDNGSKRTTTPTGNDDATWGVGLNFSQAVADGTFTFSLGHRNAGQTGEQMVDGDGRNSLCGMTKKDIEGGAGMYSALSNTQCDQIMDLPSGGSEKGTSIVDDKGAVQHFIPAKAKMMKADDATYTNAGVGVGFGAFEFNVAYATSDGGAYKVAKTPLYYNADGTTAEKGDEGAVTGTEFNWGEDGKAGGTDDAAADELVPEHTESVVEDKSKDFDVWGVSVTYTDGPMAISLGHMVHETDAGTERNATMLSASYTLAPGVAWKTSIFQVDDTTGGACTEKETEAKAGCENEGTAFVTGITLNF